jgi:hypothetical protein
VSFTVFINYCSTLDIIIPSFDFSSLIYVVNDPFITISLPSFGFRNTYSCFDLVSVYSVVTVLPTSVINADWNTIYIYCLIDNKVLTKYNTLTQFLTFMFQKQRH